MNFEIHYDDQPNKFLRKVPWRGHRIARTLRRTFSIEPVPHDAKSLGNKEFRIRIGKYRILYRVDYKEENIIVFKIEKRDRVY